MAYIDLAVLANDATFLLRVRTAVCQAAQAINGEAKGAMSDGLWQARSRMAVSILTDPDTWASRFAKAITASNIGMLITDNDGVIQGNVNVAYSKLAYAAALG